MNLSFPVWHLVAIQYRDELAAAVGPGVEVDVVDETLVVRLPRSHGFPRAAWAAVVALSGVWAELTMGAEVALVVVGGGRRVLTDHATMTAVIDGCSFDMWRDRAAWSIG